MRQFLSQTPVDELSKLIFGDESGSSTWEVSEDSANYSYSGTRSITTLDEALEFSNADLSIWQVDKYTFNSWDVTTKEGKHTNYQVKVFFVKKEDDHFASLVDILTSKLSKVKNLQYTNGNGHGVVNIADLHVGADIKDLIRTQDYNVNILAEKLERIAQIVNAKSYGKVTLNFLGDLVESITGLNHPNTFKSINRDLTGANAIIKAYELVQDHLIGKIQNLYEINVVSGNHDRVTLANETDNEGHTASLFSYLISIQYPAIKVAHNSILISKEIDGIHYIMTHGHHGISKRDAMKVIFDHGDSSKFNVILEGHLHSRISKKTLKLKVGQYKDVEFVSLDDMKYRKIVCPSLFTGNWWSESMGFGSTAGFVILENNGIGKVNAFDYCV